MLNVIPSLAGTGIMCEVPKSVIVLAQFPSCVDKLHILHGAKYGRDIYVPSVVICALN